MTAIPKATMDSAQSVNFNTLPGHVNASTDAHGDEAMTIPVPPLETPESFPFPYAKPYDIQVQLMRVVFEAIEKGKIAIVSG